MITREKAHALLIEKLPNQNLVRHCLAVEATMRALAKYFNEDQELWGIAGLLHDMDWEATRNNITLHTRKTHEWLKKIGEDHPDLVRGILSHNYK
ncbi:HDIG domain-containing protein, partial [Candidatus Microgenomates bacterium]|nr:HDIG domain-containing protein [Candidatus Microgenomates bacterium]